MRCCAGDEFGGAVEAGDVGRGVKASASARGQADSGTRSEACGCGAATLLNSTVTGNYASHNGGGIANYNGTVTITNSIVAGNSAGAVFGAYAAGNFGCPVSVAGPGGDGRYGVCE